MAINVRKRRGSLSEDDDKICLRNGNFLVSDHVIFFPLPAFLATLHQKHIPTAKQKSMTKSFDCLFDSDNYECDGARCACRRGRPPCNLLMIITPDPSYPVIRGQWQCVLYRTVDIHLSIPFICHTHTTRENIFDDRYILPDPDRYLLLIYLRLLMFNSVRKYKKVSISRYYGRTRTLLKIKTCKNKILMFQSWTRSV